MWFLRSSLLWGHAYPLIFLMQTRGLQLKCKGTSTLNMFPFFHGKYKSNYLQQLKRDHKKHEFCELNTIKLVEIYSSDIIGVDLFKSFGVEL